MPTPDALADLVRQAQDLIEDAEDTEQLFKLAGILHYLASSAQDRAHATVHHERCELTEASIRETSASVSCTLAAMKAYDITIADSSG